MPLDSEGLRDLAQLHEDRKRMARIEQALGERRPGNGSTHDGLGALVKWLAGIVAALIIAGIVGAVVMYAEMAGLKADVEWLKYRELREMRETGR